MISFFSFNDMLEIISLPDRAFSCWGELFLNGWGELFLNGWGELQFARPTGIIFYLTN